MRAALIFKFSNLALGFDIHIWRPLEQQKTRGTDRDRSVARDTSMLPQMSTLCSV